MSKLILRLIAYALTIAIVSAILPGIHVKDNSVATLIIVGAIFGLVNAFIKPVIQVLSCPLIILTLGLFALVVNALMLLLTDALAGSRFDIDGFWWAVLGALLVSIIGGALEGALGLKEKEEDKNRDKGGPMIIDA